LELELFVKHILCIRYIFLLLPNLNNAVNGSSRKHQFCEANEITKLKAQMIN